MFKSILFRCKLDNINLLTPAELNALVQRVGDAIKAVHPHVAIDPKVDVEEILPEIQSTSFGDAAIDGFMAVKRAKDGSEEFYHNLNGKSYPITREQYDAQHATPELKAQLDSARKTAGVH